VFGPVTRRNRHYMLRNNVNATTFQCVDLKKYTRKHSSYTNKDIFVPNRTLQPRLRHRIQPSFWTHPSSSYCVLKTLSPGVNRPERETENSLPSQAEVKNVWSFSSMFLILLEENGAYGNSDSATNICYKQRCRPRELLAVLYYDGN
jgi:hypothetical protein